MSSTPQQVHELFESCISRERIIEKEDIDKARRLFAKAIVFQPIFSAPDPAIPTGDKIDETLWRGRKYQELVELLKKARDRKTRWIVLARWLLQEKVCEPEDFLPEESNLVSLLNEPWKGSRRDDPRHVGLVALWLEYFKRLWADMNLLKRQKLHRVIDELVKKGYDREAAKAALGKRSVYQAVYFWLESRHRVSAATFGNAYSSARGTIKAAAEIFARNIELLTERGQEVGVVGKSFGRRRAVK